ncbi:MFS transporter [Curvibacter sp. CHRR-16]|uniref:MFS transporter n=1 Tax=Curvibacter sp. CHRR-16 TaxID=2835872 RepID=UPI001BDA1BE0|nr:MFS transporter [Curvibacter sp. CHRR-16]MBT0569134.1 MFS transporter [Curvibacter sp. CHRR-16]
MPHSPTLLILIIYLAFISLGLPDGVLGVAWPSIREQMAQPLDALGLISITLTACSALASTQAARLSERWGTGLVVAASGLMTALGLLAFSFAPSFAVMVALAVPLGLGAGAVDASLNHFVGSHYSPRHMSWLHGCWGIGASAGPFIMGLALAGQLGNGNGVGHWDSGVRSIGFMQLAFAAVLFASLALWRHAPQSTAAHMPSEAGTEPAPARDSTLLRWLAPLCFLFYVGGELGTGIWAASILIDRGHSASQASWWVSLYFGSITSGRFVIGAMANRIGNRRLILLGGVVALLGTVVFMAQPVLGAWSNAGLILMGWGCAPIFPAMMHETNRRFSPQWAQRMVARQMIFAYAGSSLVPAALGVLAQHAGLGAVMPVVVLFMALLLALNAWVNRLHAGLYNR